MSGERLAAGALEYLVRLRGHDLTAYASDIRSACTELLALRKQAALDAQSREASQVEFARLNRECNEARAEAAKFKDERNGAEERLAETAAELRDEMRRARELGVALDDARSEADDARCKIGVLLHEIALAAIACGIMRPDAPPLDGSNAIQMLRMICEREERRRGDVNTGLETKEET